MSDLETKSTNHTKGSLELTGEITFDKVSFRYSPSDPWIFRDISFKIHIGDFVAISGPSGGGKTTLMKLLLGLYFPTQGVISINGTNLDKESVLSLRKLFGVVMQGDQLLTGSISDNICFFDQNYDSDRIESAAKSARIHDEIEAMPMGYLSTIGDMGSALSGGQKQRILLARALFQKPQILVLDEGTANLDMDTENRIVDTIAKLPVTRVVVAHRLAFLDKADYRICLLYTSPSPRDLSTSRMPSSA